MHWVEAVLAGIVSTTAVVGVAVFVLRESFKRLLDARREALKHRHSLLAKEHELTLKAQIEFRERQLSEFYGPVYALLKRGRSVIHPSWVAGKLDDIDVQLRELAVRSNNAIETIILEKIHLIDGDSIPKSFIHYLTHVAVWHAFLETDHAGVPFPEEEFPEAYYPVEFEQEVYSTTERLKRELHSLYRQAGAME